MNKSLSCMFSALAVLLFATTVLAAQEFPGRSKYPGVPVIESKELYRDFQAGQVVTVDVRAAIEYDVIHIKGAVHLPTADMHFERRVQELAAANPGKKLAFYCNGVTCLRSYEGAERAAAAGVKNAFAYDAGIPEWSLIYPADTLLLGNPITDPNRQLISAAAFASRAVDFEEFKRAAAAPNALVIDVRGHEQRSRKLPGLEGALTITLDNFIANFVQRRANQDKKLLIFDQVGRQVQWLDYHLVEHGYQGYLFLKGGATGVLGVQEYAR